MSAVREGQSKKDGYLHRVKTTCCLRGPDLPHLTTPFSPPLLRQTLRFLSYVLAARANFSMERAPINETEATDTQKTAYVTDIMTLLDTVDPSWF